MFIINHSQLEIGDVILERKDQGNKGEVRESRIIRQKTESNYSHAMLYVGGASVIESNVEGVQANNIQRKIYELKTDVLILRLIEKTQDFEQKVVEYARLHIFQGYSNKDYKHVTDTVKPSTPEEPNRQFCTRFVALAYRYAGINLMDNPNFAVAKDFEQCDKLKPVEGCIKEATEEELNFARSEGIIVHQAEYNSTLFNDIRLAVGDDEIQTLEQLSEYIAKNPEKDLTIAKVIKNSEYYTMWKKMEEENPWDYDADKLKEHYGENCFQVAIEIAASAEAGIQRFEDMQAKFMMLDLLYDRESYKTFWNLYQNLVKSSQTRLSAAEAILALEK